MLNMQASKPDIATAA